jgi:hypothetical protein
MGAHALPPLRVVRNIEDPNGAAEVHPFFPMLFVQGSHETIDGQSVEEKRRKADRTRESEQVLDGVLFQDRPVSKVRTICLPSKCLAIPACAVTPAASRLLLILFDRLEHRGDARGIQVLV